MRNFKVLNSVFALMMCGVFAANAQQLRYSVALPYIGLNAYSTKQTDPLSFTNNQAALAAIKQSGFGAFGERRFLLNETTAYGLAAAFKTNKGNFGVQANYGGFSNFNESKLGLAYARSLGKALDVGVQFNYYRYSIPGFSTAAAVNFEAGIILHLSEKLNAGIHVFNPSGGNLGKLKDEKLASEYELGFGYDASDNFYISAEITKEEDKPVNITGGIQYHFLSKLFLRAGFLSSTGSAFAGVGVGFNNLRLDVSVNNHPQLGLSPGLLLIVNFKGKK